MSSIMVHEVIRRASSKSSHFSILTIVISSNVSEAPQDGQLNLDRAMVLVVLSHLGHATVNKYTCMLITCRI